jgi:hypothetical protein
VDGWIVIPGWPKFQHYKDRDPTWIKNYTRLLHDDAYDELTLAATGLLHVSWLLYAVSGGVLAVSQLRRFCTAKGDSRHFQHHLDSLIRAGFVQVVASKPLPQRREEEEKKELKAPTLKLEPPKPAPTASHRTNVVAADGFAAIEQMIRNGVIHNDLDLDAELRGYSIDGHLAESLHEQLERRLTSEQR